MSKKKRRTRLEIQRDRAEIATLRVRGLKQWEIAEKLNLSQPQISKELVAIDQEWKRSANIDFDEMRSRQLAKLDELERRSWSAYERSVSVNGVGDPRFFKSILDVIDRRCKLLGLDAPEKMEHSGRVEIYPLPEKCSTVEDWQRRADEMKSADQDQVVA